MILDQQGPAELGNGSQGLFHRQPRRCGNTPGLGEPNEEVHVLSIPKNPAIEGWVLVDLAPYVSDAGELSDAGFKHGWNIIAGCPINVPIRFNLGNLRRLDPNEANRYFAEATKASKIEVVGSESRGVKILMEVLRGGWAAAA